MYGKKDDITKPDAKRKKGDISFADLQRNGYVAGPSCVFMKGPTDGGQTDWAWGGGVRGAEQEEDYETRQRNRAAANEAAEAEARYAKQVLAHAAKLKEEAKAEKDELRQKGRLTTSQKEKAKRDAGKASRGKSYVEEEKRLAREHGHYSGFD